MKTKVSLVILLAFAGCGKSGGGASGADSTVELKHANPGFKLMVPSDLKAGREKPDGDSVSLSVHSEDFNREVFLAWAPLGSQTDPVQGFSRHGKEPDLTKIIEQGDLPGGGGKYIVLLRGKMTFTHAVLTSGKFGIECTTSSNEPAPLVSYILACKTLTAQ